MSAKILSAIIFGLCALTPVIASTGTCIYFINEYGPPNCTGPLFDSTSSSASTTTAALCSAICAGGCSGNFRNVACSWSPL